MNETPITPDAAMYWLENSGNVRPLSWTCVELTDDDARRCAATYKHALRMAKNAGTPPSLTQLRKAQRTLAAVGEGSDGASLPCYMPLVSASATVCEAVITHPFLGAIITGLLSRPVWPEGEANSRDGENLQALVLYAVIQGAPIEDCCDLAGINLSIAEIVAPFEALSVFDIVTRQIDGLIADNAPVNKDCVLAVADAALAAEPYELPPMAKRALLFWVARNNAALLYDNNAPERGLFAVLAEWTHASTTGDLAPEQGFDPALSVQAALARVQQFRSAAAGGVS